MGEYGFLTEDDVELENSLLPGAITRDGPDPLGVPWDQVAVAMKRLHGRLESALQFVNAAASANGPCRCSYAPDPSCLICQARKLLSQWQSEDIPPSAPGI